MVKILLSYNLKDFNIGLHFKKGVHLCTPSLIEKSLCPCGICCRGIFFINQFKTNILTKLKSNKFFSISKTLKSIKFFRSKNLKVLVPPEIITLGASKIIHRASLFTRLNNVYECSFGFVSMQKPQRSAHVWPRFCFSSF